MLPYDTLSDQELASLLKDGDHTAYNEIYNRYSGVLYLHACNMLRDRDEAKDVLQEIFTSIWVNRTSIELNYKFSAYLYAAVRNRVLKSLARKQREAAYYNWSHETSANSYCSTDHAVREGQLAILIEKEIDALPAKMREVFLLSRRNHLTHKEIAIQLDIAEPTVKKQVNNALKILREKFKVVYRTVILLKIFS